MASGKIELAHRWRLDVGPESFRDLQPDRRAEGRRPSGPTRTHYASSTPQWGDVFLRGSRRHQRSAINLWRGLTAQAHRRI